MSQAQAKPKARAKKISGSIVGGLATVYVTCPSCLKLRSDEKPIVIRPQEGVCRHCMGIKWQRADNKLRAKITKPRAKAKVRRKK